MQSGVSSFNYNCGFFYSLHGGLMSSVRRGHASGPTPPRGDIVGPSLQGAATLPPALRASDHDDTHYPDALPSALADRFKDNPYVMGTAVIDSSYCQCDSGHLDEFVVPVVKKKKDSSNSKNLVSRGALPASSAEPTSVEAQVSRACDAALCQDTAHRRAVLQKGYILFSDDFLASHGEMLASQCRERHGADCECCCCCAAKQAVQPSQKEVSGREESCVRGTDDNQVDRCIDEAENYHLPLFRRKPSKLVYGEGAYVACGYNTGITEPPLQVRIPRGSQASQSKPCCANAHNTPHGGASVLLKDDTPSCLSEAFDSAGL